MKLGFRGEPGLLKLLMFSVFPGIARPCRGLRQRQDFVNSVLPAPHVTSLAHLHHLRNTDLVWDLTFFAYLIHIRMPRGSHIHIFKSFKFHPPLQALELCPAQGPVCPLCTQAQSIPPSYDSQSLKKSTESSMAIISFNDLTQRYHE